MSPVAEASPAPPPRWRLPFPISAKTQRWIPPAILVLVPTVLVLKAVVGASMLYGSDVLQIFYYSRGFLGQELGSGRLALWDSHTMCGFPLMAGLQAAVFYPLTWPVVILSPGAFWTFTVWIHMCLSGLFAYAWARRGLRLGPWGSLIAGLVFMLSGYFATHMYAGHISYISSYPWLAAILWRLERLHSGVTIRRWMLLALAMALLVLAGFPHFVLFAWIAVGSRLGFDLYAGTGLLRERLRRAGVLAGAGMLGMLLAAPQLLPTMELVSLSQRVKIGSYDFATEHSMPPENLLLYVVPTLFGDATDKGVEYWGRWFLWEVSGYVGVASLLLAGLGAGSGHAQRRLWLGVALGALLVALGRYAPVYRVLYEVVPGLSLFRAPGRYLCLVTLAVAALAGMGFDRLARDTPESRRACLRAAAAAGVLLAGIVTALLVVKAGSGIWRAAVAAIDGARGEIPVEKVDLSPAFRDQRERGSVGALSGSALLVATLGAILLLRGRERLASGAAGIGLVALLAADLVLFCSRYFIGIYPEQIRGIEWPSGAVRELERRSGQPFRVVSPGVDRVADIGRCQMAGLDHVGGYEPMMLARYGELIGVLEGGHEATVVAAPYRPHPVLRMLGARYWLLPPGFPSLPEWKRIGSLGSGAAATSVDEALDALPRAYLVGRTALHPSSGARLTYMGEGPYDPAAEVVVEEAVPELSGASSWTRGAVRIVARGPGRYEMEVDAPSGGYLILTEAHYPGWRAEVDGRPVPIFRANHLVQGIVLPPGRCQVRFVYRSRFLVPGFLLCFAAAAFPVAAWLWARRRPPGLASPATPAGASTSSS